MAGREGAVLAAPFAAPRDRLAEAYLYGLMGALLGYALLGKGFAYLGMPPLYVGEIALLTGFAVFLRTNCFAGVLTTLPSMLLLALMGWVVARTAPYISRDGVEALRDTVVVSYGGFAFILVALLLSDTSRVNLLLRSYRAFVAFWVLPAGLLYLLDRFLGDALPNLPGTDIPVLSQSAGDPAVHLCGALVFVFAGLGKVRRLWIVAAVILLAIVASLSRGPMLAGIVPIVFAAVLLGKVRQLARLTGLAAALFALAYAAEPLVHQYHEPLSSQTRPISTRQIVTNIAGVLGQGDAQGEGTKEWRIEFWDGIIADTIRGKNFWTGRGFGVNLAQAYGFPGHNDPKLRDPHNVVMTMLARGGVPGMTLWLGFVGSWFLLMLRTMLLARRRRQPEWVGLFVFVMSYVLSLIVNACFDPSLEGPMQGIWFWCLVGGGLGSAMIYRQSERPPRLAVPALPPPGRSRA